MPDGPSGADTYPHGTLGVGTMRNVIHSEGVNGVTSQSASTLRSRYVAQAASDLEENRQKQRELAERITVLKQEEALLSDILNLAERYEGFADASRLPEQLQDKPVAAKAKQAPAGVAARRSTSAKTTSAKTTPAVQTAKAGAKGKSRRPLLGDLLADLLGQYDEPTSGEGVAGRTPRRNTRTATPHRRWCGTPSNPWSPRDVSGVTSSSVPSCTPW
jgi:hypothetical protein